MPVDYLEARALGIRLFGKPLIQREERSKESRVKERADRARMRFALQKLAACTQAVLRKQAGEAFQLAPDDNRVADEQ